MDALDRRGGAAVQPLSHWQAESGIQRLPNERVRKAVAGTVFPQHVRGERFIEWADGGHSVVPQHGCEHVEVEPISKHRASSQQVVGCSAQARETLPDNPADVFRNVLTRRDRHGVAQVTAVAHQMAHNCCQEERVSLRFGVEGVDDPGCDRPAVQTHDQGGDIRGRQGRERDVFTNALAAQVGQEIAEGRR